MRITRYLKYYIWGSWLNLVLYMVYCKSLHATCCIVKNGISCYNYFIKTDYIYGGNYMAREYKDQKNAETEAKIYNLKLMLPDFCAGYIRSIAGYTKPLTQLAYLQRIQFFLTWLLDYNVYFNKKYDSIEQFTIQDLDKLKKADFEEFLNHIQKYGAVLKEELDARMQTGKYIVPSKSSTRNNYLSALRSLYNYFLENDIVDKAPVLKIRQKKVDKTIPIALTDRQAESIYDTILGGSEQISARQEASRVITSARDLAIYTLALHTGIRVSELVSLDVHDINTDEHCFKIIRKRGNEDIVYFDNTTENVLLDWLDVRKNMKETLGIADDEDALFVSTKGVKKGTRLSVRSVEIMVKKYAKIAAPEVTNFHAHSLRSSCATKVYDKSLDLVYTQSVLGHANISTTMRYVKNDEKKKKENRTLLDE